MNDTLDGTPADTGSDTEEEITPPPCRAAELYIVQCPKCGRRMRLKTLRYSHLCGRSFNVVDRAHEQMIAAEAAITARMHKLQGQPSQPGQPGQSSQPPKGVKKDFSRLLNWM